MNDLLFFLQMGAEHILGKGALDHQLYLVSLSIIYANKQFKTVTILITAFTIAHSITLALASLNLINISSYFVELAIAISIFVNCVLNIINLYKPMAAKSIFFNKYILAVVFGLIHGLGFAGAIKFVTIDTSYFIKNLLMFNLGIETGQIVVVGLVLLASWLAVKILKVKYRLFVAIISSITLLITLYFIITRI